MEKTTDKPMERTLEYARIAAPRRTAPRPALLAGALLAAVLAGCAPAGLDPSGQYCGERRIELAHVMFERGREHLARHFEQRIDSALGDAYQASLDSVLLARATRNCLDFDEVIRREAINIIRSNLLFQKLIVSNMRDQDPGVVVDLYGNQYREIFKNDIQ